MSAIHIKLNTIVGGMRSSKVGKSIISCSVRAYHYVKKSERGLEAGEVEGLLIWNIAMVMKVSQV